MSIYNKTKILFSMFLLISLFSFFLLVPQPVQAVEKTLATQKSQFGFTMDIPDLRNPTKAYQDLERMRQLGVKWLRTGINTPDMIDHWGEGSQVEIEEKTMETYIQFLQKAKSYGMKIILMSVEAYPGDQSSYSNYMYETKQYWELISNELSPYADVWQIYNEPDGLNYRTYQPINRERNKDAYFKELKQSINEFSKIAKKYNPHTRITTNLYGYPINDQREKEWNYILDIISPSLDVITVDTYPEYNLEEIKKLPQRLSRLKNKYQKNIMIGEIGLQTCSQCYSKTLASNALSEYIKQIPHPDIEAIIFYKLRDDSTQDTGETTFGIYNYDGTQKSQVYQSTQKALSEYYSSYKVGGAIGSYYTKNKSRTGEPKSNEHRLSNPNGAYQVFSKGVVYWSTKTGAHFNTGAIRTKYGQLKYEKGFLGYPSSDEVRFKYLTSAVYQNYERGMITWSSKTGAQPLKGAILGTWKSLGWERSKLGLPTSGEYSSNGIIRQNFQNGYVTWSNKTGTQTHYR